MASEEVWHFVAGVAGNLFALGLFLSPMPTFARVRRNKSTEQFSGLPYIFTFLNCLMCIWYGFPFVSHNNILVTTVNGTRAIFQLFYISIYIAYSQKEARVKMLALLLLVMSILKAIAVVTYECMKQPLRMIFVGCLSVVSLISMFASPLSIIKLVIQTQCGVHAISSLSFNILDEHIVFAYGILGHDAFIIVEPAFSEAHPPKACMEMFWIIVQVSRMTRSNSGP